MRHAPGSVMVFAAGLGTRMGALTADRPKPLIKAAGKALLDHALDLTKGLRVVVNTHYKPDQIAAHLAGRDVAISHEPALLETGGGLRAALPLLGPGPVLTLNSDCVWHGPNPLNLLRAAWRPDAMSALLLLAPLPQPHGRTAPKGDFTLAPDGRLTRGGDLLFLGAQVIDPATLAPVADDSFSLNLIWNDLIPKGRAHGLIYPGEWCDVGHPGGIAEAEAMLSKGPANV